MSKFLCGECIHNGCGCLIPNNLGYVDNCQHYMHKHMPNVEMTNEEWFCGLSTEEKAKAMVEVSTRDSEITKRYYEYLLKEITEWLKQPHGGES